MDNSAENLKELTEKYIELEDNESPEEELHELAHEIDHLVYRSELYMLLNQEEEESELVALLIGEEEDDESYFIPVYTSEDEAKKAVEFFMNEQESGEFEFEKVNGAEIIAAYEEDDDFLGLAINFPENEFVVFADTVHDCCDE